MKGLFCLIGLLCLSGSALSNSFNTAPIDAEVTSASVFDTTPDVEVPMQFVSHELEQEPAFSTTPQHYPVTQPEKQLPAQAPQACTTGDCGMQKAQAQYRQGVPVVRFIGGGAERRQTRRASRGGLFRGLFRGC